MFPLPFYTAINNKKELRLLSKYVLDNYNMYISVGSDYPQEIRIGRVNTCYGNYGHSYVFGNYHNHNIPFINISNFMMSKETNNLLFLLED